MSLLLAPDAVELFRPGELDGRGWRELGDEHVPFWRGAGNFQLSPGPSDPRAAAGGGRGPAEPAADERGLLYLPPDAELGEGYGARVRGRLFVLSQVRYVTDPIGVGDGLDCWMATATGTGTWPDG